MREKIDGLGDLTYNLEHDDYLEDKEYEYRVEDSICQKKGLMGYKDHRILGSHDPDMIMQRINADINKFVQFCNKYGVSYNVSEMEEYSSDCRLSDGVKGRIKTVKKEIVFTLPSNVRQKLIHEECAKKIKEAKVYLISRAGDWYNRIKGSEAVMEIAEKMLQYIKEIRADWKKEVFYDITIVYECNQLGTTVRPLYDRSKSQTIEYADLGYQKLGSSEQCAAVAAALLTILEERVKPDPELFDIKAMVGHGYTDEVIFSMIPKADKESAKKKQLKAW